MRVILAALCALLPALAVAQSMSPMRGEVASFDDRFAVRVFPGNPYGHRIRVEVKVYDQSFRPVEAEVLPSSFMLGAEASRPVLVVIPFAGAAERKVRICTESIPFPGQNTQIRAQICGKFLARRL
jgi:hypothetical protein